MDDDSYCHVCHRSDERGRKHVYTKKHKERVNAALRKFEAKMQPAKQCVLSGPTILKCDPSEVVDKFWCPFCLAEVKKHERCSGQVIAQFKSWAEHLCSEEHHKRVHEFFWTNKLDMKKRDKYKLNQEKLESLEDKSKKNLDKFTEDSLQAIKEEASRIREVEKRRSVLQAGSSAQSKPGSEIDSFDSELCSLEGDGRRIPASVTTGGGGGAIHHSNPVRNTVNPHPYDGSTRYHTGREMNSSNANIVHNKIRHDAPSSSTQHAMRNDWNVSSEERNISRGPPPWVGSSFKDLCDTPVPSVVGVTTSSFYRPVRQVYRTDNRPSPESSNSSHTNVQRTQGAPTISSQLSVRDEASSSLSSGPGSSQPEIDPLLKVKTARVISSGGLTVISRKKFNLRGNVHTGSVPPWLQEDSGSHDDDTPTVVIGPTEEDLQKHLENERKRKLNPKRVGANFDHSSETPDEWLPSFGRVWNHGPRWRSRKQYKKEVDGKLKKGKR